MALEGVPVKRGGLQDESPDPGQWEETLQVTFMKTEGGGTCPSIWTWSLAGGGALGREAGNRNKSGGGGGLQAWVLNKDVDLGAASTWEVEGRHTGESWPKSRLGTA